MRARQRTRAAILGALLAWAPAARADDPPPSDGPATDAI